jgi:predicted RNase H-like HicB family nuclease
MNEVHMTNKISIVIEKDEFGYYAFAPELPGCQSQGNTLDEAMSNIREAVELYLETMDQEEISEAICHEVFTTSLEIGHAQAA